jgi:hypothetical protein
MLKLTGSRVTLPACNGGDPLHCNRKVMNHDLFDAGSRIADRLNIRHLGSINSVVFRAYATALTGHKVPVQVCCYQDKVAHFAPLFPHRRWRFLALEKFTKSFSTLGNAWLCPVFKLIKWEIRFCLILML